MNMEVPETPLDKPKKKRIMPIARSRTYWRRELEFDVDDAEHKIYYPGRNRTGRVIQMMKTRDTYGLADLVALKPGFVGTFYIQVTTNANAAEHLKKALVNPILVRLLQTGNHFLVHSWLKSKKTDTYTHKMQFVRLGWGHQMGEFGQTFFGAIPEDFASHLWVVQVEPKVYKMDNVRAIDFEEGEAEAVLEIPEEARQ